jgi:hypothetical protein
MEIIDITGRILQNIQLESQGIERFAMDFPVGVYFIRLSSDGQIETVKIINN